MANTLKPEPATDPSDWLTPQELAARLDCGVSWVFEQTRAWTSPQSSTLPLHRMGKKFLRFYWPEISQWLMQKQKLTGQSEQKMNEGVTRGALIRPHPGRNFYPLTPYLPASTILLACMNRQREKRNGEETHDNQRNGKDGRQGACEVLDRRTAQGNRAKAIGARWAKPRKGGRS